MIRTQGHTSAPGRSDLSEVWRKAGLTWINWSPSSRKAHNSPFLDVFSVEMLHLMDYFRWGNSLARSPKSELKFRSETWFPIFLLFSKRIFVSELLEVYHSDNKQFKFFFVFKTSLTHFYLRKKSPEFIFLVKEF